MAVWRAYATPLCWNRLWHDRNSFTPMRIPPTLSIWAAAYTAGLLQNHVFFDGNKRTGFVVGILFLELNGYRFTAPEDAATQAVVELAAGTLDEAGYAAFLRAHTMAGEC